MKKETPAQQCARIVRALEDLAAQEAAAVETCDFTAAYGVQERAAPLVDFLVQQADSFRDEALANRVKAVHTLRAKTGERLGAEIVRTREALREMQAVRSRVAQVGPAYGRSRDPFGSWRAVG
jgi:hypothetical protein